MRTNIDIDDELLAEAMRLTGAPTKKAAVDIALRELVARKSRKGILELFGTIGWEGDLMAMREDGNLGNW